MSDFTKKHGIFLAGLQQRQGFKDWLEDIEAQAPQLPSFDPQGDQTQEVWIYRSGMREGYKLALSYLGVKLDE